MIVIISVMSAAQRSALARHSRTYQLQAECCCALLLAGESYVVPGLLFCTSFRNRHLAVDNYA